MLEFICYFMPAFISTSIHKYLNKEKDNKNLIINYGIYCALINMLTLLVVVIKHLSIPYTFDMITVSYCFKYLFVAIVFSIIMPFLLMKIREKDYKIVKKIMEFIKKKLVLLKKFNNLCSVLSPIIVFISFYLLDIFIRAKCFELTNYYALNETSTNLITIGYCILFTTIICFFKKKGSTIIYSVLYGVFFLLYLTQYFLLSIKKNAFTIYDISYADEGMDYLNFLIREINFKFVLTIVLFIIVFTVGLIFLRKRSYLKVNKKNRIIKICASLALIITFVLLRYEGIKLFGPYDPNDWDCYNKPSYYYNNLTNVNRSLNVLGLYEYTFKDIYLFLIVDNEKDSIENIEETIKNRNLKLEENDYTGIFKDKNLIMIMLESIDNVIVDSTTTPTLVKMQREGINFTKRYGQLSKGGVTLATEYTSQTGLYYTGKTSSIFKDNYKASIPNVFEKHGYKSTFVHENYSTFYNRTTLINSVGFDNTFYVPERLPKYIYGDDHLLDYDEIYNSIVNKDGKFMTLLTTISAHGPYTNNYHCNSGMNEKECFIFLSKQTDKFLELLLNRLEKDKLLDDTIIVLFTDHYAYPYNYTQKELEKTYKKIDDNYSIKDLPFVIYNPNIKHKEVKDILVNDIDILPTIFNMFGIEYDPNIYVGIDVFSKNHRNLIMFTDRSWYDGKIYSLNVGVDTSTEEFLLNTRITNETYDLNNRIINSNYYASLE